MELTSLDQVYQRTILTSELISIVRFHKSYYLVRARKNLAPDLGAHLYLSLCLVWDRILDLLNRLQPYFRTYSYGLVVDN